MPRPKKKTLRQPTAEERKKGLPKTKAEALKIGLIRFIPEDGEERIIRNYGSRAAPNGNVARATTRDATRDSKTSLGLSRRTRNETISTPRVKDRAKQTADYQKAKQDAKSQGKDHHHITPVYLTGNAKAQMDRRSRRRYELRMQRAGTPTGNTAENVMAATRGPKGTHAKAHAEGKALQDKLKAAERQNPSPSLNRRSRASQLGQNRIPAPTPSRSRFLPRESNITPRTAFSAASQVINQSADRLRNQLESRINSNMPLPAPRIGLV